ncbi:hypothetical protein LJC37_00315 [Bacteroidales bacterium OttesenSCG-928-E04]|nr:hypothetical protein [Bacteroidales bacterium OttesenSCG-928-E04]
MKTGIISLLSSFLLCLVLPFVVVGQAVDEPFDRLEKELNEVRRLNKRESMALLEQMYRICRENPENNNYFARTLIAHVYMNEDQGVKDDQLQETILRELERKDISAYDEVLLKSALMNTFYTQGDFVHTFEISLDVLEQAKQLNDSLTVARSLNVLGSICRITDLNAMAEEYYVEALNWVPNSDEILYYSIKTNLFSACLMSAVKEDSYSYRDSLLLLIDELGEKKITGVLAALYVNVSGYMENEDDYYNCLEKALTLYVDNPHKYALVTTHIGLYYLNEKQDNAKSLAHFKIAQEIWEESDFHYLKQVYENTSKVYEEEGQIDSAFFYLKKAAQIDEIYKNNRQMLESSRKHIMALLENAEQKLALANVKNKLKNKQLIISLIMTIAALLAGLLLLLFFRQKRKRMRQEVLLKEAEANELVAKLEKEQAVQQAQAELLESKSRELASYSLLISNKNHLLRQILSISESFPTADKVVKRQIRKVVNDNIQNEDDWGDFMMHFEKIHPDFFAKIKENCLDITPGELKLAAYIRLGLSTKDIAQMLNMTIDSVKVARSRLRKKMGLNREDRLENIIQKL